MITKNPPTYTERVPAWVECEWCEGMGSHDMDSPVIEGMCARCQGEGGKWHEAVEYYRTTGIVWEGYKLKGNRAHTKDDVTKQSHLIRTLQECGFCGEGRRTFQDEIGDPYGCECQDCEGTGATLDGAGEWKVSDEL